MPCLLRTFRMGAGMKRSSRPSKPGGRGPNGPCDAHLQFIHPTNSPVVCSSRAAITSRSIIPAGRGLPPDEPRPADLRHTDPHLTGVHLVPPSVQAPTDPADLKEPPQIAPRRVEPDRFLKEKEASRILSLSPKTLQAYRQSGKGGPAYHVLGKKRGIRYRLHELLRWASAREVRSR